MKRFYAYLVAAFALTAVSCSTDATEEVTPAEPVQTGTVEMTFSASNDETRTLLDYDNRQTLWTDGDTISILDDQGGNNEFTIKEHDGVSAIFTGKVNEGATKFVAVYPYNAAYSWDGTTISGVEIPAAQTCTAGSFPEESNITVAVADEKYSLAFKNVCSILKFTVPEFTQTITEITISANNALAGTVNVTADGEDPVHELVSGENTVTLTGTFEAGKSYFCAVIPGEQSDLVVSFNDYLSKSATGKNLNFKRSAIMDLKTLPTPVASQWQIVGGHNSWNLTTGTKMYPNKEGLLVAKNVTLNSDGFKFIKGTSNWNTQIGGTDGDDTQDENIKMDNAWYRSYINYNNHKDHICVSNTTLKYDIYLSLYGGGSNNTEVRFYVVPAGTEVNYLSLIGVINGSTWNQDVCFTPYANNANTLVAKNVNITGEFKIRRVGGWDDSWSNGSTCAVGTKYASFTSGSNMKVSPTGTYDVYITTTWQYGIPNPAAMWIMKPGEVPSF